MGDFFAFINAGGDFEYKKPHLSNIQACLEFLGEKPMAYLGDSVVDQQTAKNGGLDFYFFEGGYDDGVDRSQAAFTFQHYNELVSHLGLKK